MITTARPLVIGVGNRWRSDDGVGPVIADTLVRLGHAAGDVTVSGVVPGDADVVTLDGEPARLVAAWDGRSHVVVVDAIVTGDRPGTVHLIDELERVPSPRSEASSHGGGVAAAIALGRVLGRLPERLVVIGVEPARTGHGDQLSPAVEAAVDDVARLVVEEVGIRCA